MTIQDDECDDRNGKGKVVTRKNNLEREFEMLMKREMGQRGRDTQ
jgi:hypothetical protein